MNREDEMAPITTRVLAWHRTMRLGSRDPIRVEHIRAVMDAC